MGWAARETVARDFLLAYPGQVGDPKTAGQRYLIRTFGCQMNEHDSERIAGLLEADGMVPATGLDDADVVVLNTCCIRENADNKLYGHLGHLASAKAARPSMRIAVGGCLAQKDKALVRKRAPYVDVVFGTHNLSRAPELLKRAVTEGPLVEIEELPAMVPSGGPPLEDLYRSMPARSGAPVSLLRQSTKAPIYEPEARRSRAHAAWVTIQVGCDNSCAFCIVPSVRGPEVSRPFEEIVDEVRTLVGAGVVEVTLLGQNVNSYGRDITRRRPLFAELLAAVGSVEGIRRVRFTSPHPKDLRAEVIQAMADIPAVCEQLHLPLQSGSDSVLKAMRRGYTAERYLQRLEEARRAVQDLAVTTDLIVGFPGETEDDFARTLEVVSQACFDSAYTFIFSPRPGTRAAGMEASFVAQEVVSERFERLKVVVERSALAKNRDRVGRVEEVLVEGLSKRDPQMVTGRTRQGKPVHFPLPAGRSVAGSFQQVKVIAAAPHHLLGELAGPVGTPQ